jgi:hypothetical protein
MNGHRLPIRQQQNSAYRFASLHFGQIFRIGPKARRGVHNMANRKGVFIGAYVPNELKESLRRRAAAEHRTLSQEITRILIEAVHGRGLPAGSVDRRGSTAIPRRRSTDPPTRRRAEDLPYIPEPKGKK